MREEEEKGKKKKEYKGGRKKRKSKERERQREREREREETLYRRNTLYSPSTKGLSRGFKPLRTVYVMRLHIHCKPCLMERERENGKKKCKMINS